MADNGSATETSSGETEPAYDVETYRHAIEEARRTLDQQLQAFNDVADKGWRIVQLNGIIATIYASAVVNSLSALNFSTKSLLSIFIGFFLMAVSIFLVISEQESHKIMIGQGTEAFRSMRENDPEEIVYLYETIKSYEKWIDDVGKKTKYNGRIIEAAKISLTVGVGFILTGTIGAI